MIQQIAAKAVIVDKDGRVLIVRKSVEYKDGPNAGLYDFPGGRLEIGEKYEDALIREAKEEVGIEVEFVRPIYIDEWRPVIKGEQYQIVGIFSLCKVNKFDVSLDSENDQFLWFNFNEEANINLMGPADKLLSLLKDNPKLLEA